MPKQKSLHVIVIGAGIVGASIAYHLSQRDGVTVTVLEKDEPGSGASGHSFAWLNSFGKDPDFYHQFNRRSMDLWRRFADRLGTDIGLHWGGELRWRKTVEDTEVLRRRVKQLQMWGYPCRMVTVDEMYELEPGLEPGPVAAASLSEIDGRVEPHRVIDACLERAQERGAVVQTRTPVMGCRLDRRKQHLEAVETSTGTMPCDVVVLASGVHTTALARQAGVNIPQRESPGVIVRIEDAPRVLQTVSVIHAPAVDAHQREIHLRSCADGTLRMGQGTQENEDRDDSQAHADDLLRRATHYLPALVGARATPIPVGYRPMPIDGLPILGFCQRVPNLYIAVMHSGVTLAPLVGELAAMEIVDGVRVEMLAPYRPERF
ncbi:MAG: FAD-binding oxidoreductase [Candidatus Poribacteria bacterium]|nr:FAD-binding oxidoreductase [Candidatus Poribacteria bacterium]